MDEEREVADELIRFAKLAVEKLLRNYRLKWNSHRIEEAEQDLVEVGWRVWLKKKNLGFARNRITDRSKNLLREYRSELRHEPINESDLKDNSGQPSHPLPERSSLRENPAQLALVEDYLQSLEQRAGQMLRLRMDECTNQEIADAMGVSCRSAQRVFEELREGYKHEHMHESENRSP